MSDSIKLHLGCGNKPIRGFYNVDILKLPGVDVICDLRNLNCFKENIAHVIYASHFLEHFSTEEVPLIISHIHRVLKKNGELRLSVPDLDKICQLYVKNINWFTPPHNPWLGLFYGGQKDKFDFHKTGFNLRWLKYLLELGGFVNVEEIDYFEEHGVLDGSFANMPFGKISLNVRAYKVSSKSKASPAYKQHIIEKILAKVETGISVVLKIIVSLRLRLIHRR